MNLYHSTAAMNSNRLASLDILRGFDLFMLLFFQPVLMAIGRAADSPSLIQSCIISNMRHGKASEHGIS